MDFQATPFPLDFDALNKGDVISEDRLESITSEKRGTKEYQFKTMSLADRIERELAERGLSAYAVVRREQIRILTDDEAKEHTEHLGLQAVRKLFRAFRKGAAVDTTGFTIDQKQEHERQILMLGRYAAAIKQVRRELTVEPTTRNVPGLVSGPKEAAG